MKLLLLNGSLRSGSVNGAVLNTVRHLAPPDIQPELYAGMATLPHFNPDDDHDPLPQAVTNLRTALAAADALLICTPEYAGALPGAFKNLLEWTVGSLVMNEKPVAWVNASTNPSGAKNAHHSLRIVLGYVNARIVQDACLDLPVARRLIGPDELIHDLAVRDALVQVVERLRQAAEGGRS